MTAVGFNLLLTAVDIRSSVSYVHTPHAQRGAVPTLLRNIKMSLNWARQLLFVEEPVRFMWNDEIIIAV